MLLNRLEYALMNNPVRAAVQRRIEARRLLALGGPVHGVALELGCGQGVGAEIILDVFGASRVDGFDLDPRMMARARARLRRRGAAVRLWTGDATAIPAAAGTYDAAFDFGIIHHVPDWRAVVAEVARVLKPGGRFYAEEVMRAFIGHPVVRRLLAHPQLNRFDREEFLQALARAGLRPLGSTAWAGMFAWVVAQREP